MNFKDVDYIYNEKLEKNAQNFLKEDPKDPEDEFVTKLNEDFVIIHIT